MWMWTLLGCRVTPTPPRGGPSSDTGFLSPCALPPEYIYNEDRSHVEGGVTYDDPPPTSGPHDPCWTTWGVHTEEVGDEHWVHNLEHGGVVFLYNCPEGCADDVAAMTTMVESLGDFAVLTPYSLMPWRFGVVSWGVRREFTCVDVDAMTAFYDIHHNHAPESLASDPGSGCM